MSYNPSIPALANLTLQSQAQIRSNFQTIESTWDRNHVPLTNKNNELKGMHQVLLFNERNSDPVTSATQIGLYTKAVSGVPQLFYAPSSSQTPIQMTNTSIQTGLQSIPPAPDVYFADQYSFLPGPFYIAGGFVVAPTNGQIVTVPPLTTILYVGLTTANIRATINFEPNGTRVYATVPTDITGNTFKIRYQTLPVGISLDVYYFAVGI